MGLCGGGTVEIQEQRSARLLKRLKGAETRRRAQRRQLQLCADADHLQAAAPRNAHALSRRRRRREADEAKQSSAEGVWRRRRDRARRMELRRHVRCQRNFIHRNSRAELSAHRAETTGPGRTPPVRSGQLRPIAATASLQAGCTPQRVVDSLLPTRPILLKMGNQIAVEFDRHQFFRDGNVTFSLHADRLGRCRSRWFEHSFGYGQGVGRSKPIRWSCHANFSRCVS